LSRCDIRQVRHAKGKISSAAMERREQITADPVQPLSYAKTLGILSGDLQCLIGTINRPHVCLGQRMRQTDRQGATPCPHIQDSETSVWIRCPPLLCQTYALLNQHFAFRAWDEHVRTHGKFQRPEFLLSRDVLHRLTAQPALQAPDVGRLLVCTEGAGRIQIKMRACRLQQITQEHFCCGSRFRHTVSLQTAYRVSESSSDG